MGPVTIAELPLAERTSRSPSPAMWLVSHFSPSLVSVCGVAKYPCASWESARAPSARRFASIRERVELTRFWHLVPHLLTTLIWFPLKTWLLYMIFNSIFSAFACLETPYVYVARGVLYHPACGLLESYSLSQCCSHAPRSFSGSYRLYFAGNIQIRWDIIECIELTCAFNYKLAI